MKENRVVITGLGAVTPIGIGIKNYWEGLLAGQSGIAKVTLFDVTGYRAQLAAEVKDFNPQDWIDKKSIGRMDRFTHFAIASSTMAMRDSGLESYSFDGTRAGVIVGSGIGGMQTIDDGFTRLIEKGPKSIQPFFVSKLLINMAACMISIKYGLKGHLSAPSVACSTGSVSIGDAFRILQRGNADIMLAGGAEASIYPLAYGGFCATRSMTPNKNPENASRPFDKNRDGFVIGEGAGIVVLETLDHALKRKAKIHAEIIGYGNTADAYHYTAPHPQSDGMIRVMQEALKDANISQQEVGYINAHGTSTVLNDKCESAAINEVFGDYAKTLKVSSNKSMIGHLMAAAGAVEFIASTMTIKTGKIPPTINYEQPDPDCQLDYVTNGAETVNPNIAMSNSFGFGGGNACLIIKKYKE